MLASPVPIDKVQKLIDKGYWAEPKLDGWRCIASRRNNKVELFTRRGKRLTEKLPDIVDQLSRVPKRIGDFTLDGEVGYPVDDPNMWDHGSCLPRIDNNKTRRVLGSDPGEAIRKQEYHGISPDLFIFDILYQGEVLFPATYSQRQRRNMLWDFYDESGLGDTDNVWITHSIEGPLVMEVYNMYVDEGGEGFMFKNPIALYEPGKRVANTWYKLKKFETVDVVIMGFTEGQGKYAGQIGAIEFGLYRGDRHPVLQSYELVKLGQCSGMDDLVRAQITGDSDNYIGRVLELKYFGKTAGSPQFPQFVCLRTDKDPYECTIGTFK